jgi:hypothetical protein
MTPKEKAEELCLKYNNLWINGNSIIAKVCASIAVDEILNELDDIRNFTGSKLSLRMIEYFQEVKQEIEKL